jgi:hypothetical protein
MHKFFMPKANAFSPQLPAATCAANGVDFLEPLKPEPPEVAQQTAFTNKEKIKKSRY